jgi:aminoglycoside/choline kinase family phosphotransferase
LLLSDLGSCLYLDELRARAKLNQHEGVDRLYAEALNALVIMQTAGGTAARELPPYDRALLLREMELFPEWFLERHIGLAIRDEERRMLERLFNTLAQAALSQPWAFVHRDYHSRNLLLTKDNNPGILDFQDAVLGPITYDAVSLLKDCYVAWPAEKVRRWVLGYREQLLRVGIPGGTEAAEFILGIFARLYYRDGKPGYLNDLPRVLDYTRTAAIAYPETAEFAEFLLKRVDPAFAAAQALY